MRLRPAWAGDAAACAGVLGALPEHFTADTHAAVVQAVGEPAPGRAGLVAETGRAVVGFLVVERRHPRAAEITFAAVVPESQGRGVGRALVDTALAELGRDGVVLVVVKTLDATAGYEPYVATRAFWERRGFVQVDAIDPLPGWQPGNPAAIYVAALDATR